MAHSKPKTKLFNLSNYASFLLEIKSLEPETYTWFRSIYKPDFICPGGSFEEFFLDSSTNYLQSVKEYII